ncbi:MAG: RNA 2',3'-cyclic phosphodiesterase, partial [Deltaproteobacteria bacterium]
MRLFAALTFPDAVLDEIAAWHAGASPALPPGQWRDVSRENWHLTLAFYGDAGGDEADDLAEALAACAAAASPLRLRLSAPGVFPGLDRPRVFWLGVEEAEVDHAGRLAALARCCRRAGRATLRKRTAKDTPFRAHVTLARSRGYPLPMGAERFADMPPPPDIVWTVEDMVLFRSELH